MAEITVFDFAGLKNAIEDTTSTSIYLGSDITFSAGGIVVPRTKGDITIDGSGYTINDRVSSAYTETIRFDNVYGGAAVTMTIQNVVWNGRNHYGIVQVYDTSYQSNVTIVLKNLSYTGPQAIHNRAGTTKIFDCTFSIERNGSPDVAQELCETRNLVIGGNVTVNNSGAISTLWFTNADTSFTILEDAHFVVTSENSYIIYADGSEPAMTFQRNSVTEMYSLYGLYLIASTSLQMASTFLIEEGATFKSVQSSRYGAVPAFKCRNNLTMQEGSSLFLAMTSAGTSNLMYFPVYATLNFNNPKSVVLYNNGGNIFSFGQGTTASPNTINIDAELLNFWTTAAAYNIAGTFDDIPTKSVRKADRSNIEATFNTTTSTTTAVNSNVVDGDLGFPLSTSTFNIMQAKVLSFGNLNLTIDKIKDNSLAIVGLTESNAAVRINYDAIQIDDQASFSGEFRTPLDATLAVGTVVTVGANWQFLTKYDDFEVVGSVSITYLPPLVFSAFAVPYHLQFVKRVDPNWRLEVTDTRESGGDWDLFVSLPTPLTNGGDSLNDAVVLKQNDVVSILSQTPMFVTSGQWGIPPKVTTVTWNENEGFWLAVSDFSYSGGKYASELNWEIVEE